MNPQYERGTDDYWGHTSVLSGPMIFVRVASGMLPSLLVGFWLNPVQQSFLIPDTQI